MKIKTALTTALLMLLSLQAHAYQTEFKSVSFTNKKNIFTPKDNCVMWATINSGVGDIYFLSRQHINEKGTFKNKIVAHLNRYTLEREVLRNENCKSGQCEFSMDAKHLMQNSAQRTKMKDQVFTINGTLNSNTISIDSVYVSDSQGYELINCYK